MLVYIGKFLLSTLRWVPMCKGFGISQCFSLFFTGQIGHQQQRVNIQACIRDHLLIEISSKKTIINRMYIHHNFLIKKGNLSDSFYQWLYIITDALEDPSQTIYYICNQSITIKIHYKIHYKITLLVHILKLVMSITPSDNLNKLVSVLLYL